MADSPYTPVVVAGDWIAVSGQVPRRDGVLLTDRPFAEQVDAVLLNLADRLTEVGARPADVVKATIFLVDMADYPVLNERWLKFWPDPRPARSCVAVAGLPFGVPVEIECWARRV